MINRSDSWGKNIELTNWFLRIIRTLEKFQLWLEVKNCSSGKKKPLNSFFYVLLCMHATSLTWAMCLNLKAFFAQKEKLLHKPIIYHIPKKHEKKTIVVVAQPQKNQTPAQSLESTQKKKLWIKKNFFSAHKVSCFSFSFDI